MPRPCVYIGDDLARYGFDQGHPYGVDRLGAFSREFKRRGLERHVEVLDPVSATVKDLALFHSVDHIAKLQAMSKLGHGFLDAGDTPAFPGVLEASLYVVGSVLDAVRRLMAAEFQRAFVPIAGLHHAGRDHAAGFCTVNDCAIAIEALKQQHGLTRIAYVDIDAHHGDGVFYAFDSDPDVIDIDFHEDGQYLYPGSGGSDERGRGSAKGMKLNIPLPPAADDLAFFERWPEAVALLEARQPQFIILQAGADSLKNDPITHLELSSRVHRTVARDLCRIADRHAQGRVLALGGGGYEQANIARAWNDVVQALVDAGA